MEYLRWRFSFWFLTDHGRKVREVFCLYRRPVLAQGQLSCFSQADSTVNGGRRRHSI